MALNLFLSKTRQRDRDPVRRMESAIRFIMMHAKAAYRRHTDPEARRRHRVWFDVIELLFLMCPFLSMCQES